MYMFNIITTYSDGEQDFFDIEMNNEQIKNEQSFLFTLFRGESNLTNIIKYSICQKCKNINEFLPFLRHRNGKYYFNEEDIEALNIKNKFLKYRNCN